MTSAPGGPRSRDAGFSLIEAMVGISVLALLLAGIGPLMVVSSRRSQTISAVARRNAALAETARYYGTVAYSQLTPGTTCTTVTAEPFPNTTCTTIAAVTATVTEISVAVTPAVFPAIGPASMTFRRANLLSYNPLNMP